MRRQEETGWYCAIIDEVGMPKSKEKLLGAE
jgi:hypothetical protein